MKTLFFLAAVLAAGAQAREPENLAVLVDEMVVLERVLGAALESRVSELAKSRFDFQALHRQTGMQLEHYLRESVSNINAEYLARQGILVSLQFGHRPSARDLPSALFETMARTGETRLPGLIGSLEPDDFTELKRLIDEQDGVHEKYVELARGWHVEYSNANASGKQTRPEQSGPIGRELSALQTRQAELQGAIQTESQRLRGLLVETSQEASPDDIHGALVQVVCDYAMLKSLPDDEYLTLRVRQLTSPWEESRTGPQWTYYVLGKQDVVDCRHGSIDADELRQRAYVYSREYD